MNDLSFRQTDEAASWVIRLSEDGVMTFQAKGLEYLQFHPNGDAYVRGEKMPVGNADAYEMALAWLKTVHAAMKVKGSEVFPVPRAFIEDVLKTIDLLSHDDEQTSIEAKWALRGHLMALGLDNLPYDPSLEFPKPSDVADAKIGRDLCSILSSYVGETGESEGAVEVLTRLLDEVHKARGTK